MASANRTIREGLVLGLIGTASVAAFYAAFDMLAARGLLFTPNLLGRVVFEGLRDPSILVGPIDIEPATVAMYSALHLVVSLAIGLVVAWLVEQLEGPPAQRRLALLVIAAGFFVTIFGVGLVYAPISPVLPWWSIVLANVFAVAVAGAWVLGRHPGLIRRLVLVSD